jgi:hypothetical protein
MKIIVASRTWFGQPADIARKMTQQKQKILDQGAIPDSKSVEPKSDSIDLFQPHPRDLITHDDTDR